MYIFTPQIVNGVQWGTTEMRGPFRSTPFTQTIRLMVRSFYVELKNDRA